MSRRHKATEQQLCYVRHAVPEKGEGRFGEG